MLARRRTRPRDARCAASTTCRRWSPDCTSSSACGLRRSSTPPRSIRRCLIRRSATGSRSSRRSATWCSGSTRGSGERRSARITRTTRSPWRIPTRRERGHRAGWCRGPPWESTSTPGRRSRRCSLGDARTATWRSRSSPRCPTTNSALSLRRRMRPRLPGPEEASKCLAGAPGRDQRLVVAPPVRRPRPRGGRRVPRVGWLGPLRARRQPGASTEYRRSSPAGRGTRGVALWDPGSDPFGNWSDGHLVGPAAGPGGAGPGAGAVTPPGWPCRFRPGSLCGRCCRCGRRRRGRRSIGRMGRRRRC